LGGVEGDAWFNSHTGKYYIYYDSYWVETSSSVIGPTGPTGALGPLDSAEDVVITTPTEGDTLVYDGESWINRPEAGRNLLYNGAMQVHQRGTSATGITGAGYYTADRWATYTEGTVGTWTQTGEAEGPTGSGLTKSVKLLCTTANASLDAGDRMLFSQRIEGQNLQALKKGTANAESVTLSFWVKSNVTGTYTVDLADITNARQISASYTVATSGTWAKKTITFAGDTTGTLNNDNLQNMNINFWLVAGSDFTSGTFNTSWASSTAANRAVGQTNLAAATSNYWQITGVQFEIGPVATPFEFKSFGQELAECQRYYYRTQAGLDHRMPGYARSTTLASVYTPFPVTMRINPTALEQTGTAGNYGVVYAATGAACSAVPTFLSASTDSATSTFTVASGLTAGQGIMGYTVTSTAGYLAWSAEL
jgi:hypothetical protein